MKKTLLAVAILVIYGIGSGDLLACGDKFLVASRGTRYQRAGQARRASILVYEHAKSTLPKAFERVSEDVTKKAGYRVTSVANANELEQALRQGGWDVILADLADSPAVRDRIRSTGAPGAPLLVPVAYGVTGTEIAQAKREYQRILKGPIKTYAFLEAMDDILALRNKLLKS